MIPSLLLLIASAAPHNPPADTDPPPPLAQKAPWLLRSRWDGILYFGADGTYYHQSPGGSTWVGTWHKAGDGSTVVRERHLSRDTGELGGEMVWNVLLTWDAQRRQYSGPVGGDYAGGTLVITREGK